MEWYIIIMKHFIRYLAFSCARSSSPVATTASSTTGGSPAETRHTTYRSCKSPATLVCSSTTPAAQLAHFQAHGEKSAFSIGSCFSFLPKLPWNMETRPDKWTAVCRFPNNIKKGIHVYKLGSCPAWFTVHRIDMQDITSHTICTVRKYMMYIFSDLLVHRLLMCTTIFCNIM